MNGNDEKSGGDAWLKNLSLQAENPAFAPEEMLACAACGRVNPPIRSHCFYCAAELPVSEKYQSVRQSQKLNLRTLENWEKGFNLIFLKKTAENVNFRQIGETLNLSGDAAEKIIESKKTLPLLRAETRKEAEIVRERLFDAGVETKIISDEELLPETAPRRLRALTFADGKLVVTLFNTGETAETTSADLILIVTGAIFERRAEAIEKRKKGEVKILESSETASDEILIDFYTRDDAAGYRILTKGFDFSCLGAEKGILARENLKKLAAKLREFAPAAKLSEDYLQVREILGNVWEIDHHRDAKGLKRHGYKFDFANVETSSNLRQFTKYSRLQRQIL